MIKALYTSITGMSATQNALSVTSNNIANAQTAGYKKQKAIFDDLLYNNTVGSRGDGSYAGTNPKSVGNGLKFSGTATDFSDGSITLTGEKMETAIEGNGLFIVGDRNGGNIEYTRKGSFGASADNFITSTGGQYVLGYGVKPGTQEIDFSSQPSAIKLPIGSAIGGSVTDKATLGGNLSRNQSNLSTDFTIYDDEGNSITLRLDIKQVTRKEPVGDGKGDGDGEKTVDVPVPGEYTYTFSMRNDSQNEKEFKPVNGEDGTPLTKNIKFDKTGKLEKLDEDVQRNPNTGEVTQGGTIKIPFANKDLELNLGGLTNYPTGKTLTATNVAGRPAAIANDYSISDGGFVMMRYSDGSMKVVGQLAVATFPNTGGLMKSGNGNYIATPSSGIPAIGVAGENGAGNVRGGAKESSNVDLSVEFVDLMLYQRGFQGNAKVIKVSDEVLNEVVNLIR
ncbi:flagellar hook protein FlgE [Bacillus albus]|uniref:flagellar hook protein FlgE n=1 Tax=Bacillus TaxID=1386 RepID=UPI00065BECEC|nr:MULTISPECIES: flagellar hook protein FlgE [Bacillus]KMP35300.1 flagellar hook protein FlgE [Bacillus cereus]MBF7152443.1 flagellar hook protein FlgE [Bacillus albus]MBU5215955.1 flagellar hook protein FlgE [Bacillus albus]MDA2025201.1 flagellar hook protein FlgE [Bacillus cereus group sp. Bcc03]MDA2214947.1 flagellar hook protein FlgE [Bacillus cereus group sp. Bc228]